MGAAAKLLPRHKTTTQSGTPTHTPRRNSTHDNHLWSALALHAQTKLPVSTPSSASEHKQDLKRIYSFGPTGAGRMQKVSGLTIFSPAAPVDAQGNELVRAGTPSNPILSYFGRFFTLDLAEHPYPHPPPVPACSVRFLYEWVPDDGAVVTRGENHDAAARYYQPGQPLGTNLGDKYLFPNDRPGVLTIAYVFNSPNTDFLLMKHGVHFVDDPSAPDGMTGINDNISSQAAAAPNSKAGNASNNASAASQPAKASDKKSSSQPEHQTHQLTVAEKVNKAYDLSEQIKKAGDAVTRDPLVKKLRDILAGLQPFMSVKDAKKKIDDSIDSLVKTGSDAAMMALLKGITGKSPSTIPKDRNQYGPNVPQKNVNEHIFHSPNITIDDVPKPAPKTSFHYRNGPHRMYRPGEMISFTIIPPDNFNSISGAKRVVIVAESDRNKRNPDKFGNVRLESSAPIQVELVAPQKPGKYVIRVDIGLTFEHDSMRKFEVVSVK